VTQKSTEFILVYIFIFDMADAAFQQTQRVSPDLKPKEISFPLPKALHTTGHVHLTFLGHCATIFLATSTPGDSAGSIKPLGSFVYAMPDVSSLKTSKEKKRKRTLFLNMIN